MAKRAAAPSADEAATKVSRIPAAAPLPACSLPNLNADYSPEPGFHSIDLTFAGLQCVHRSPDIFVVHDFLAEDECARLVALGGASALRRSRVSADAGDARAGDARDGRRGAERTSESTSVRQADAPAVAAKLMALLRCDARNLHVLSLLRYTAGQYFRAHCDEDNDGVAAPFAGFDASHRVCTCFVYLNDVARGGETAFVELGPLTIRPRRGMAVVHFPGRLDRTSDARCRHEAREATDEKWLLAAWADLDRRSDDDARWGEYSWPREAARSLAGFLLDSGTQLVSWGERAEDEADTPAEADGADAQRGTPWRDGG